MHYYELTDNDNNNNNNNWRASERDTLRGNAIEISQYLFIYLSVYGVRETSVFARASNYVS